MKRKLVIPMLISLAFTLSACPIQFNWGGGSGGNGGGGNGGQTDTNGGLKNGGLILDTNTSKTISIPGDSSNGQNYTWTIEDSTIATVTNGTVNGIKAGKTTLHVVSKSDETVKADYTIKVRDPLDAASLWDDSQSSLRTGTKRLDFYNLNDFHGATATEGNDPGINYLSSYFEYRKQQNPDGFVFSNSGDMWQGSADSNITRGRLVTDWLNLINCRAMTVGNHEFDWTVDVINANQAYMDFDMVCCNIIQDANNQPVDWVRPYTGFTVNGVNVGVIGAIGEGITSSILASNVRGLTFADPNPYINQWATHLKNNGADIVMVLLHDTVTSLTSTGAQNIDLLFGGHTHTNENKLSYNVPCIQGKNNGQSVGHIAIEYNFSSGSSSCLSREYIPSSSFVSSFNVHAETKALYDRYLETEINVIKSEVCSTYTGGIDYYDIPYVFDRYSYMYFNDTYKKEHNSIDLLFTWTNQARTEIPSGHSITYGDIYKALPFDNCLCLMKMTGSELSSLLNKANNYGYCYAPSSGNCTPNDISSLITSYSATYYFLVIDYIIESERYNVPSSNFEYKFMEEEALPRNVFKKYVKDYPSNI